MHFSLHFLSPLPLSSECIDAWLVINRVCPMCKANIFEGAASAPTASQRAAAAGPQTNEAPTNGGAATTDMEGGETEVTPSSVASEHGLEGSIAEVSSKQVTQAHAVASALLL
jgi:hypothetical protein